MTIPLIEEGRERLEPLRSEVIAILQFPEHRPDFFFPLTDAMDAATLATVAEIRHGPEWTDLEPAVLMQDLRLGPLGGEKLMVAKLVTHDYSPYEESAVFANVARVLNDQPANFGQQAEGHVNYFAWAVSWMRMIDPHSLISQDVWSFMAGCAGVEGLVLMPYPLEESQYHLNHLLKDHTVRLALEADRIEAAGLHQAELIRQVYAYCATRWQKVKKELQHVARKLGE